MAPTRHHVTFRFRLPPALALRAPLGVWPRSPRGCMVDVGDQGNILVTSIDMHETYARNQVLTVAAQFLRDVDSNISPTVLHGHLSAPSCRHRDEVYSISLGARVTIGRADPHCAPLVVLGPKPAEQLDLLKHAAG